MTFHQIQKHFEFTNFPSIQVNEHLESILASSRKFDLIKIEFTSLNEDELKNLIKIAEKHGRTIKKFLLSCDFLQRSYCHVVNAKLFSKLLQLLPNVQEWKLDYNGSEKVMFRGEVQPAFKLDSLSLPRDKMQSDDDSFINLNHKFASFIALNSLTKLETMGMVAFKDFLKRQSNLKSISVNSHSDDSKFRQSLRDAAAYKHLKLEEFSWNDNIKCPHEQNRIIDFLVQLVLDHPSLQKIISPYNSEPNVVKAICRNCHQLRYLEIKLTNENIVNFTGIKNLAQLEELSIRFSSDFSSFDIFMEIAKLDLPRIKKLKLFTLRNLETGLASAVRILGRHWMNIEELQLNHDCRPEINSILESFKKLKSLGTGMDPGGNDVYEINQIYPGIEKLSVYMAASQRNFELLHHLLGALPNLCSLNLETCRYTGPISIQALIELRKLRHLNISFQVERQYIPTIEDAEAIKQLCQHVEEQFEVNFFASDESFIYILAPCLEMGERNFSIDATIGNGDWQTMSELKLKNYEY